MWLRTIILACLAVSTAAAQTSPHGAITQPCSACHTTDSWRMRSDASFDHAATGFELVEQHARVECRACHADLKFSAASASCRTCHTDVHRGELGTTCQRCHDQRSWQVADMRQRHQETRFALVGAHASAACDECHQPARGQQYAGTPITCIGCHRETYAATAAPAHATAGFSTNCTSCHSAASLSWGGSFDHATTAFPLTGAHRSIACVDCHVSGRFSGTPTTCQSCHATAYAATTAPHHASAGFAQTCQTCHSTTAWTPSSFDHAATGFPLTGAHRGTTCASCHANNVYAGTGRTCVTCHNADYAATQTPNHTASGFPQTCENCHGTSAWVPSSFNHDATRFPLAGAHRAVVCTQCHVNNTYAGTSTECIVCHQASYAGTTNPPHVSLQFPATCLTCHSMSGWTPASFDHSATRLPLTGAHAAAACQACHVNNNYQLVYQDCYGCHQSDFTVSTRLNHTTNQLSHACESCHTTTAWSPNTFNHDTQWFKILNTGKHRGKWSTCMECHTSAGVYTSFSCTTCHEHNDKASVDSDHREVNGYVYASPNCYSCHRNV